jgi:ABC-type polysaccharide/polyol phosphate export permease
VSILAWSGREISNFLCLQRRFLISIFVGRNLKVKYRGSFLGYVWTLAIPIFQVAVFYFVYKIVLGIQTPNYLAYIVSGILPWVFFSTSVTESMESIVGAEGLLNHAPIPIQTFPVTATMTNLFNLLTSLPVLGLVLWWSGPQFSVEKALAIGPLIFLFALFTYAGGLILSILFIYLRDLRHVLGIVLQVGMYFTPILYSPEMIPEGFRWIIKFNPLASFFEAFRSSLNLSQGDPWVGLATFSVWTVLMIVLAWICLKTLARRAVESL